MQYSVFTDTDWLYPDSAHSGIKNIRLTVPRGGHAGAQILGELPKTSPRLQFVWHQDSQNAGLTVRLFRLLPVGVTENTDSSLMTTTDFERCKSFVTRKAPFDVYDALCPIEDETVTDRLAVYLCIDADADAVPGNYSGELRLYEGCQETKIPLTCRVSPVRVPHLSSSALGMLNFFDYDGLANQHHVTKNSEEYWSLFSGYVRAQAEMRCTHILLPPGEAVF